VRDGSHNRPREKYAHEHENEAAKSECAAPDQQRNPFYGGWSKERCCGSDGISGNFGNDGTRIPMRDASDENHFHIFGEKRDGVKSLPFLNQEGDSAWFLAESFLSLSQ
jgi:hypothetical protein